MAFHYIKIHSSDAALHTFPNDLRASAEVRFGASADNNIAVQVESVDNGQTVIRQVTLGWLRSIIGGIAPEKTASDRLAEAMKQAVHNSSAQSNPTAQADGDDGA
jgi:hypothetical protein